MHSARTSTTHRPPVAASVIAEDTRIEVVDPLPIQPVWWDEGLKPVDHPPRAEGTPQARAIVLPAAAGRRTILVSSAASTDPDTDVAAEALSVLDDASSSFDALREQHVKWWHAYWARTFVHLHSEDGLADYFERIRHAAPLLRGMRLARRCPVTPGLRAQLSDQRRQPSARHPDLALDR